MLKTNTDLQINYASRKKSKHIVFIAECGGDSGLYVGRSQGATFLVLILHRSVEESPLPGISGLPCPAERSLATLGLSTLSKAAAGSGRDRPSVGTLSAVDTWWSCLRPPGMAGGATNPHPASGPGCTRVPRLRSSQSRKMKERCPLLP